MESDLVNWWTVLFQLINFIILVVLLKYLLYDRVIEAMKERDRRIQQQMQDAQKKQQEADQAAEEYEQKNRELEEQREQRLRKAREEAEEQRLQMTREAREETDALRRRWQESLRDEQESFLRRLREEAGEQVVGVCRQSLRDVANEDLENAAIEKFLRKLGQQSDVRQALKGQVEEEGEISVFTSFDSDEERRGHLTDALRQILDRDVRVDFETDPDLICGVEVRTGGRAVGWHIAGYLDAIEEDFEELLEEKQPRAEKDEVEHEEEDEAAEEAEATAEGGRQE
jgi:F-type H+-transporting ATPase subunit b